MLRLTATRTKAPIAAATTNTASECGRLLSYPALHRRSVTEAIARTPPVASVAVAATARAP